MVMSRPRVLVSDLGNVLLRFDHGPAYRAIEAAFRGGTPEGTFASEFVATGYGRGVLGSRDFYDHLKAKFDLSLEYERFCHIWCDIFVEDTELLALVRELAVAHRVLLSNTNDI